MTSATLSAKKKTKFSDFMNIAVWSLKKHKALAIVYASLLLFSSPVIGTLTSISIGTLNNPVTFFTFASLSTIVTMLMTFIISVMMFDYLHNKRQADVFGSLPCTRRTLFFSRYTTGLVMIIVPYIINMLIVAFMTISVSSIQNSSYLFINTLLIGLIVLISVIASYSFTAFMAVCCGTTANTVLTTLLINFAYPIAIAMLSILGSSIVPGVNLHIDQIPLISNFLSPYGSSMGGIINIIASFFRGGEYEYNFFAENWQQLVAWAILIAASFIGCYFLTKKRKTESAQNSFAFKAPSVIIRFIATAAIGLLVSLMFTFTMYISRISDNTSANDIAAIIQSSAWTTFAVFLIAFIITSFLTHLVATVIFNKGFKGFAKSLISYAAVVLCVCLLYTSLAFGGFGADKYIPQSDKVSSVEITNSGNPFAGNTGIGTAFSLFGMGLYNSVYLDESDTIVCSGEKSINLAIELHQEIVDNLNTVNPKPYYINTLGDPYTSYLSRYTFENPDVDSIYNTDNPFYTNPTSLKLLYHMKDGTTVERTYSKGYYCNINMTGKLEEIEAIASEENSAKLKSLLSGESGDITMFSIKPNWYGGSISNITQPKLVDELSKAILTDINSNAPNNYSFGNNIYCKMVLSYREKRSSSDSKINITLPMSYKNSVKLISEYGYTTSLNLLCGNGSMISNDISEYFLDSKTGMLSEDAVEQFFTLPDNVSTDYLQNRTTQDGSDYDSKHSIFYDMTLFLDEEADEYGKDNYDEYPNEAEIINADKLSYRVANTDSEGNLYYADNYEYPNEVEIIDADKLSYRVVYTDSEGNLYYYNAGSKIQDYDFGEITLYNLRDKTDKNKVYYPFVIQAYSDEEKLYTTPVNIAETGICACINSKAEVKDNTYVFLTAG
ncbi:MULTISPECIES: ABC transporter permease [unclassified Ruminococcus]|uniref:ABC transporter permease n=1 Tax=unclassified Ruminococcus TaxID=2608920 RepID=UPI00210D2DDE|nr:MULTISPECIES: ABC transporter permease [unclassified Ruminococcus]MCQ4022460.1 hypothetical protein [Ruminococcus sp. zg-924]MCQ4115724.1 hypothetical protein [Ruminococcus sp. zg-921]